MIPPVSVALSNPSCPLTLVLIVIEASSDGQIMFWMVGQPAAVAKLEGAHEAPINGLAYHPVGHLLASCEWLTELLGRK